MIFGPLQHPEILSTLASAGHGTCVLVADGNFPVATQTPPTAKKVFLNLRRGLIKVTDVLEVLRETIPIEHAMLMATPDGQPAPIHNEFFKLLPAGVKSHALPRAEFYAAARSADTALVIATGEEQRFANLLLTIGVIKAEAV
jgi:L-fucose mutarotase